MPAPVLCSRILLFKGDEDRIHGIDYSYAIYHIAILSDGYLIPQGGEFVANRRALCQTSNLRHDDFIGPHYRIVWSL